MLGLLADWAQAEDILRAIEIDDAPVIDCDTLLGAGAWSSSCTAVLERQEHPR
jgi:hypothetical protein